ncbi:uncharacterized protein CDV56_103546 [Aspergillus thermomutatus]|uniref:Uncharacterized protein n=1 Tax=Aspergillus thermomutatus TaxID=41047 RepID=A0A397G4P1_ASPTH|nr:uncharacterized protein CDV56_103546 [Aspergillus thermomutatus]RHZ45039.1 hypothetical protein CDV56_103546 [Aspergillus thermomutatus]
MPRPVVNYHNDLSRLHQRFGLTRRPSLASINGLSVGQAMLLRTLLLSLVNRTRHSHDYRISAATQLEVLALIDQLKRRINEANAIALFAAFGLPHSADATHLAALDLISLETFHDGLVVLREGALPDRHLLNAGFLADLQRVWEASLTLLDAEGSVVPANCIKVHDEDFDKGPCSTFRIREALNIMSYVNPLALSSDEKNMLFRDATATLFIDINKTSDFLFESLGPSDADVPYAKAKVKVPEDSRFSSNWGVIELLLYKIFSRISGDGKICNANTYFRNGQDGVRPGAVLILEAHRVGESLLEAQISYAEGSLIATASAIYRPIQVEGKCLAAPIDFGTTNAKQAASPGVPELA